MSSYRCQAVLSLIVLVALAVFIAPACDESTPFTSDPHSPYIPSDPSPTNGSSSGSLLMTLAWDGGDPDGDPVVYDIYLGSTRVPELIIESHYATSFTTPILKANQRYFWRVIARDAGGKSTSSPLWSFQTSVKESDFVFPSTVGNSWIYRGAYYNTSPIFDVIPPGLTLDTFDLSLRTHVAGIDTLSDGKSAYSIASFHVREMPQRDIRDPRADHGRYTDTSWYRDEIDGQYLVARSSQRRALPPDHSDAEWLSNGASPIDVDDFVFDPIGGPYLLDPPRKEIAYPLKTGAIWLYSNAVFNRIVKTVIGRKRIDVPAGSFECWEIQWRFYQPGEKSESFTIEMVEYIAEIGTVAKYMRVNGLLWVDFATPDGGSGFVDFVEYYELEEYDID